jgi:hypothetical protein
MIADSVIIAASALLHVAAASPSILSMFVHGSNGRSVEMSFAGGWPVRIIRETASIAARNNVVRRSRWSESRQRKLKTDETTRDRFIAEFATEIE